MYRAKQLSVGVAVYVPEDDEHRPERLAYLTDLRSAVDDDQLVLHFQPRLDLATGRRTAVEALVRWQHPTEGLLPPARFIPLAEPTGLMEPLTRRVLALALAQARHWRDQGRDLPVAVNISASVLHDTDLVGTVLEALHGAGLPPSALELEVTESAMMSSPASAIRVAHALEAAGVRLSVDDFGTGHSSLAYLRDLPVSQLKIDRSFLRNVPEDARGVSIVRSVIELGHHLGLRVVGEGIETLESLALLTELGCGRGPGLPPGSTRSRRVPALIPGGVTRNGGGVGTDVHACSRARWQRTRPARLRRCRSRLGGCGQAGREPT
ncbi:MAG: EAL domain-containing protein [Actinomycetota bacterium]|nr:EAL domain-containing protein [Actinomycetota bacterium]